MAESNLVRRKILKTIGAGVVGGAMLSGTATANQADAMVNLHPVNKDASGNRIRGKSTIDDTNDGLVVSGTAQGMDPANSDGYLSLFYDEKSTPDGPVACEPSEDNDLTDGQMEAAIWTVNSEGVGTATDLDEEPVELSEIGTMSIRDLRINNGFGPEAVVACGKVTPAASSRR